MEVCCQNLPLGAFSSRGAPSLLVGELFKKFGLFLNTGVKDFPDITVVFVYVSKPNCTNPIQGHSTEVHITKLCSKVNKQGNVNVREVLPTLAPISILP
jgi:hypothetical protein